MTTLKNIEEEKIWQMLEEVCDPEVPVLSVLDLGIVRAVKIDGESIEIVITPTYSGCPAIDTIHFDIRLKLLENGYKDIAITTLLSPAWTTDWMTVSGKEKLKEFGIAPPNLTQHVCDTTSLGELEAIQCPICNSYHTKLISQFGSTACKALYKCLDCLEPFDYFKCH